MRFLVLGTTEFTLRCASGVLDRSGDVCALVSTPGDARPANSADVSAFARTKGIPYHEAEDINAAESVDLVRSYAPDYVLSSWPRILKKAALESARFGCIGTHPTALPFNRGRHPLHWLIVLGIPETVLTFFRMDEGVDTGNVLLQVPFGIGSEDTVAQAVSAMNDAAYEGTRILCERLQREPGYSGEAQEQGVANYWRKRTPHDVTLDPRMPSSTILRIVRSYAPPYPGANLVYEDRVIKVSGAAVAETTPRMSPDQLQRLEPGRILSINGSTLRVKVDDALMDLECQGHLPDLMRDARHIHPPTKYMSRWPEVSATLT